MTQAAAPHEPNFNLRTVNLFTGLPRAGAFARTLRLGGHGPGALNI